MAFWHWLVHVTGSDYGLPYGHFSFYDLLSGSASDLGELALIGAILGAFAAWYRRNNCHVASCRRISHRQVSGLDDHGQPVIYHICRRHNPVAPPSAEDIHRHHHALRRARSGESCERVHQSAPEGKP